MPDPAPPKAPVPANEPQRLAALRAMDILDTPPEQEFDDLTFLASHICGTPISLMSLVDSGRQWVKANVGSPFTEGERDVAFCSHAIMQEHVLMIPDTQSDPRFANNPLVTGKPFVRFYAGAPLLTAEGHALGTICVIDDRPRQLSEEQQRALEALSRQAMRLMHLRLAGRQVCAARDAAEAASRAKSRFLSNMSHELRTPLNAIIGYSEMLIEDFDATPRRQMMEDLGKIRTAGKHLLGLINELLDMSKIEAGRMTVQAERVDVEGLVSEVCSMVQPLVAAKLNQLRLESSPDAGRMHTDGMRLRQCLFNLLSNAAKFTQKGTITLTVHREQGQDDGRLVFEVADTGIGITPAQMERIFEPFAQGDAATTRRFGGTGLGLALTRQLAQMLGGSLRVRSEPGKGSTFTLDLPATMPEQPADSCGSEDKP